MDVVYFRGEQVNVEKFKHFHPGGRQFLNVYSGKEIKTVLRNYGHPHSTYDILKSIDASDFDGFVDWSKPLIHQVGSLGKHYPVWLEAPVFKSMRLFGSNWLEMQTKTKVHEIVLYWVPISFILITSAWQDRLTDQEADLRFAHWITFTQLVLLVFMGVLNWTIIEYFIHRWIFHGKPPDSSPLMITIHFMMHGVHHKVPFDQDRLLFPIVPATVISIALYGQYSIILPKWMSMAVMGGTILGYVTYDLIHHYLHHGSPAPGTYLYFMKRYHNQHHFTDSSKGFGISSNLWDEAFSTSFHLRKLNRFLYQ